MRVALLERSLEGIMLVKISEVFKALVRLWGYGEKVKLPRIPHNRHRVTMLHERKPGSR